MVRQGGSVRATRAPGAVLAIGGWGVHMPYHATWVHETEAEVPDDAARLRTVADAAELAAAIRSLEERAGGPGEPPAT